MSRLSTVVKIMSTAALLAAAGAATAQVQSGRVDVSFGPFTIDLTVGNGSFAVASPGVGDYDFGAAFPAASGVLLTNAFEIAEFADAENGTFVCSAGVTGGNFGVRTFEHNGIDPNTGEPQANDINLFDRNLAIDHDFSFAYFPFADGWIAGSAFPASTAANGPLTTMNSTAVQLVTEEDFASYDGTFAALLDVPEEVYAPFVPRDTDAVDTTVGKYILSLPQFNNVHRDGILIASSPSGESQIVMPVMAQNDNDSYISPFFDNLDPAKCLQLWVYDTNSFIAGSEADGVSFVYIPFGTTFTAAARGVDAPLPLPMGMVNGSAVLQRFQGDLTFELTRTDGDNNAVAWTEAELKAGFLTPANATLLAFSAGGSNQSQDNLLTYEPNDAGDGWRLQLRDGPNAAEDGLSPEFHAIQFVVIPDGADITPGGVPEPSITTTVAGLFTMEALATGNGRGTATSAPGFPPALDIVQVGGSDLWSIVADNRGDNVVAVDRLIAGPVAGVTIPQAAELGRFDIDGGEKDLDAGTDTRTYKTIIEYSNAAFENRLITESINDGGEIDTNFAMVNFPAELGFPQQPEVYYFALEADGDPAAEIVPAATEAAMGFGTDEGVAFGRSSGNNQNIIIVDIDADKFEFRNIQPDEQRDFEGSEDPVTGIDTDSARLGWVAVPYSTPGLIAGQINADGTVANGTGGFSVTQTTITAEIINADLTDSGVTKDYIGYNLMIPGVDSNTDGVLVLQGIGDVTADPNAPYPIYGNADDGSFNVVVLDVSERDIAMDDNILDEDADELLPWMFAYVPFTGLPGEPVDPGRLCADQNEDGNLTGADFNAFLTNFSNGDPKADLNGDGNLTGADFNGWLTAFSAGLDGPRCNP